MCGHVYTWGHQQYVLHQTLTGVRQMPPDKFQGTPESPHFSKWGNEKSCERFTISRWNGRCWKMGGSQSPRGRVTKNFEHLGSFNYGRLGVVGDC